jgi:hypothetical protein
MQELLKNVPIVVVTTFIVALYVLSKLKLSWLVPISHLLHFYSGAKLAKFGTKTGPGVHDTKTIALYINVFYFVLDLPEFIMLLLGSLSYKNCVSEPSLRLTS